MRTVIFDLDGTLADTSGDLIAAGNAAFREMGLGDVLDPAADGRTAMIGGGRAMLKAGFERLGRPFGEAEIAAGYPVLLTAYAANIDRHTRLYPGTVAAIEGLLADGYAVGVCTNKPEALAHQLLTALGVRALFASLIGADTLTVRKPDPAPMHAAVTRAGGGYRAVHSGRRLDHGSGNRASGGGAFLARHVWAGRARCGGVAAGRAAGALRRSGGGGDAVDRVGLGPCAGSRREPRG